MITGRQIREARKSLGWTQRELALKAKVTISVVVRAENSPGEPVIKIVKGNVLLSVLRAAGVNLPADNEATD